MARPISNLIKDIIRQQGLQQDPISNLYGVPIVFPPVAHTPTGNGTWVLHFLNTLKQYGPDDIISKSTSIQLQADPVLVASDGTINYNSLDGTTMVSTTISTIQPIVIPVVANCAGKQIKVYVGDTLLRGSIGGINIPVSIPAGDTQISVIIYGAGVVPADVTLPADVTFSVGNTSPPTPKWVDSGAINSHYIDPKTGTTGISLNWYNQENVGGWGIYSVTSTPYGNAGNFSIQGDKWILKTNFSGIPPYESALVQINGISLGTIDNAYYDDNSNSMFIVLDVFNDLSAADFNGIYSGIVNVFSFNNIANIARTSLGAIITFIDTSVTTGTAYSYCIDSYSPTDSSVRSSKSIVVNVTAGDIFPPGPVTLNYWVIQGTTLTVYYNTPVDLDYYATKAIYYYQGSGAGPIINTSLVNDAGVPSASDSLSFDISNYSSGTVVLLTTDLVGNTQPVMSGVSFYYDTGGFIRWHGPLLYTFGGSTGAVLSGTLDANGNQIINIGTSNSQFTATGQLQIGVTTGTPPLIISSTTVIPNLNADMVDGLHASSFAQFTADGGFNVLGNFGVTGSAIFSGTSSFLLPMSLSSGVSTIGGVRLWPATAKITIDGIDDQILPGQIGISETGGNLQISGRGSVQIGLDNDNNQTNTQFTIGHDGITSGLFSVDESGNVVNAGTLQPSAGLQVQGGFGTWGSGWTKEIEIDNGAIIKWTANAAGFRHAIGQTTAGLFFSRSTSDTTSVSSTIAFTVQDTGQIGLNTGSPKSVVHVITSGNAGVPGYAIWQSDPSVAYGGGVLLTNNPNTITGNETSFKMTSTFNNTFGRARFGWVLNSDPETFIDSGTVMEFGSHQTIGFAGTPFSTSSLLKFTGVLDNLNGTTQRAFDFDAQSNLLATSASEVIAIRGGTQAFSYTTAQVNALHIFDAILGSTSTITAQAGLRIDNQTKGQTNFAIITGTGWNQFGDITAWGTSPNTAKALVSTLSATASAGFASSFEIGGTVNAAANNDTLRGITINNSFSVGAFTGTTAIGLRISNITGAASNFSIQTGTGTVSFGDVLNMNNNVIQNIGNAGTDFLSNGGLTLANDLTINALGAFDSTATPTTDFVLSYNGTAAKWQPRFIQVGFTSGQVTSQINADKTYASFVNTVTSPAGAVTAPTQAPVVTAIYNGFIVDMSAYGALPANQQFVVDYSINSGSTFTANAIVTTGQKIVFSNANIGWGYEFKYKVRGGSDSAYGPASTLTASSATAEVNAFGIITASQISTFSLSSINANIGDISAGQVRNSTNTAGILFSNSIPSTWTQGIFLANANPPPGTVTGMYIDFSATGSNNILYHPSIQLKANGTAIFSGTVTADTLNIGKGGFLSIASGTMTAPLTINIPSSPAVAGGIIFVQGGTGKILMELGSNGTVSSLSWGDNFSGPYLQFTSTTKTLQTNNSIIWDNDAGLYDIGFATGIGFGRPRNVYVGNNLNVGGLMLFSGTSPTDIGSVAFPPRDLYLSRNASIGGTLSVAGPTVLSGTVTISGTLLFSPDNIKDIGAFGATRPRTLYLGTDLSVQGNFGIIGNTIHSGTSVFSGTTMVVNNLFLEKNIILNSGTAAYGVFDNGTKSANFTIDWTKGMIQKVTLGATSLTVTFTSPPAAGTIVTLEVYQDGTGSRTITTWPATVKWANGGTAPTLTTTASRADILTFLYNGTNYAGLVSGFNFVSL